jgi:hypothetical protein
MMGLVSTLYLLGIFAIFVGAGYLPRWRVLLVTLGVLAILLPAAAVVALVIELRHHPMRMGY